MVPYSPNTALIGLAAVALGLSGLGLGSAPAHADPSPYLILAQTADVPSQEQDRNLSEIRENRKARRQERRDRVKRHHRRYHSDNVEGPLSKSARGLYVPGYDMESVLENQYYGNRN